MWKKIIFVSLLIVVVFAILFFLFFSPKKQGNGGFPTPTPFNQGFGGAGSGAIQNANPTIVEQDRESGFVLQMAQGLPYYGKNFSLFYDFNSNSFIVHINPLSVADGNAELTSFLKKNKIDNASWIKNLTTIYQSP
jgi:hypothetical protein